MLNKKTRTRPARRGGYRHSRNPPWLKIIALTMVPLSLTAGAGYAINNILKRTPTIAGSRCYDEAMQHHSAALIDFSFTASTSQRQQQDLKTALVKAYSAMPANGMFSVFTTSRQSAGGDIMVADFSVCKPAETPAQQKAVAGYADSPLVLRKQAGIAQTELLDHVRQVFEDSRNEEKIALDSPILESIQSITRHYATLALNNLLIYSDGIQNSELLQFCKTKGHMPPYELFKQRSEYQDLKPEILPGTQVDFFLVEMGPLPAPGFRYCSNRELRDFYPAYFNGHGASTQLTRIRYGAAS